ncbi:LytTR family DNA-binding domain-containing protein [Jiulongibacter sediminis]|jgi:two-component system LytT family response regulator|uniref:LytR/AlgR family response regulator transcription factor n=1 Tax=Jiulongibacter sediminis TaxID=1605367 RepID=UPI0026EFF36A|nr:LytTR family DNA-binding domain-containing protein [Jiulongibacter sediminis]
MKTDIENRVHLGSRIHVAPHTILVLKADQNYTEIILTDGSKILSSTTMGKIEKRLEDYNFFRPNRSTIINLEYFQRLQKAVSSSVIEMKKIGKEMVCPITVSRRRLPSFLAQIES